MVLNIFRRFLPKYLHGNFVSANIHTMLEVEDINKYTDPYLYKIFPLIIKYAKDDDVEKIIFECFDLLSCDMELMCRYMANYSCKEFLVHLLLFDIWDYKFTPKKHQILSLLRELLITHLNSIGACYCNYYFPAEIDDNEPKIKQPINLKPPQKSPKELKDLIFSINKVYNADNLKDFEITNILHEIIYNYSKNHFYYVLRDECIWKIEIRYNVEYKVEKAIIGEISQYNLINRDREPCLIDVKTGLEIGIGRQIKTPFIKNGNTIMLQINTYDSFLGTNERIIKALTFKPVQCHWCNPDTSITNEKVKCERCRILLNELNDFNSNIYKKGAQKSDLNKYVTSIGINEVANLSELRKRRKELLISFVNENKKYIDDKELIETVKSSIKDSFSSHIAYSQL